jgi:glycosyltransferase involved in cell wall biosynthesis
LIPHGNWIGFYPQSESKEEARRSLGLSGSGFVFLFFGQCKPYKNLEGLIDAFGKVAYQDDTLLIVGSFADEAYLQSIQRKIAGDGRIKLTPGYVADAYVARYLLACDAMCMPYNEILTSGTTMLAMSFGRPVLSIDRGFLRDVMTPDCGLLIEPNNAEALEKGLTDLRDRKWKESEILMIAEKFTYAEAARICIAELADLGMHL